MEKVIQDVACTVCGCVCDDLRITVQDGRIVRADGACFLAEPWFLEGHDRRPPTAEIHGVRAAYEDACSEAVRLLRSSRSPLIYGLSRSSTQGQRSAVRLAESLGATIDTTASLCHAPSIMAIQEVGESTCSLGEVRNRADLVVFWGADPVLSHPRHFERYSVEPIGMFLPRGRADRTVVVIDEVETDTSRTADVFIPVKTGCSFEMIWALRLLLRGLEPAVGAECGAPLPVLQSLVEKLKSCRTGVVFFGLGLARAQLGHRNVEALLRLVTDLNAHTRFYAKRMRIPGDVTGADSVLCWQTGFPFSVNLARGYPRFNPGEYTANEMLERGEVDACVLVGSESIIEMSAAARAHLERIPTIALDYPHVQRQWNATVQFTTAVYGIHLEGTAYRMDEVPVPLRAFLPAEYPSDAEVLDAINEALIKPADWRQRPATASRSLPQAASG